MKYIKQFTIIVLISFVGELMNYFIPLPIPASIYGLVIMLVLLTTGALKLEMIRDVAGFLLTIMPLMFIPIAVGLIESWDIIQPRVIQYSIVTFVSLIVVFMASGWATQLVIRRGGRQK